ncbi:MAG: DNA-3-methyladenine glycosylase 2 family protein, partial [Actinobacteria bacterium]|nr:DNA-3-methyladenine glycosylase 2 family protein [Actinomycetota bacterium]
MPRRDGVPELRLSYRLPFATGNLLAFLGRRAISGVELVTGGVYARSIRLPGHGPIVIGLAPDPVEPFVALRVTGLGGDATRLASVVRAARRLFDLDADPSSVDSVIAGDPV